MCNILYEAFVSSLILSHLHSFPANPPQVHIFTMFTKNSESSGEKIADFVPVRALRIGMLILLILYIPAFAMNIT